MSADTVAGIPVDDQLLVNYFNSLVDRFFKIVPIREENDETLPVYMHSLQVELMGCCGFIPELSEDSSYLTLLSILQYLIEHPECDFKMVRREAFRAIGICKQLKRAYAKRGC